MFLFLCAGWKTREKTGVRAGDLFMSFRMIFQDVRSSMDHVHLHGDLQNETVAVSVKLMKMTFEMWRKYFSSQTVSNGN